jgi:uncharacterized protein YkwD
VEVRTSDDWQSIGAGFRDKRAYHLQGLAAKTAYAMRALRILLRQLLGGLLAAQLLGGLLAAPVAALPLVLEDSVTTFGAASVSAVVINDPEQALIRERVIVLVNHERLTRGLPPLQEEPILRIAAQSYAEVLTADSCFGHTCGPVPDFTTRDAQVGYTPWSWLGENVAAGQPTAETVVAAWMASPLHRENILRPEFTELGVGVAHGGMHGTYWAQEFGARPPEPS